MFFMILGIKKIFLGKNNWASINCNFMYSYMLGGFQIGTW
jgi:hypothetical protein